METAISHQDRGCPSYPSNRRKVVDPSSSKNALTSSRFRAILAPPWLPSLRRTSARSPPISRCRTRRKLPDGWPISALSTPSCWSSTAATGDRSVSASWRGIVIASRSRCRSVWVLSPSRSTRRTARALSPSSSTCRSSCSPIRHAESWRRMGSSTGPKRVASPIPPPSSSTGTAPCASVRSTEPPHGWS